MNSSTNIFTPDAISAADGLRCDATGDKPWLCALLLRWPPTARLVEFPLPRADGQERSYAFAFRDQDRRHFLPMSPQTPFTADIPAQVTRTFRRSTVASYITKGLSLRAAIPMPSGTTDGSLTLVSGKNAHGRATSDLLVKEGEITTAGKRFRETLDPPHGQADWSSDKLIQRLVLPDSDPSTWQDGSCFCPIHGCVQPITAIRASPAWTWPSLCGHESTSLVCPRCLYFFHSVRIRIS
jgi:hypothetical protein